MATLASLFQQGGVGAEEIDAQNFGKREQQVGGQRAFREYLVDVAPVAGYLRGEPRDGAPLVLQRLADHLPDVRQSRIIRHKEDANYF